MAIRKLLPGLALLAIAGVGCATPVPVRATFTLDAVPEGSAPAASTSPSPSPTPAATPGTDGSPVPIPSLSPPAGDPVPQDFYRAYQPAFKPGAKWTRRVTTAELVLTDTTTIVSVNGDTAHVRQTEVSSSGLANTPREYDMSADSNPVLALLPGGLQAAGSATLFARQGTETVNVPGGTFMDCAKLGISGVSDGVPYTATAWLAPGIGVVKLVATSIDTPPITSTQELLSFETP